LALSSSKENFLIEAGLFGGGFIVLAGEGLVSFLSSSITGKFSYAESYIEDFTCSASLTLTSLGKKSPKKSAPVGSFISEGF
jgi:hypothetical protein